MSVFTKPAGRLDDRMVLLDRGLPTGVLYRLDHWGNDLCLDALAKNRPGVNRQSSDPVQSRFIMHNAEAKGLARQNRDPCLPRSNKIP